MDDVKICFLDCDGVMNSIDYIVKLNGGFDDPKNQMDPEAVVRLNRITEATGAVIVISSVWRILPTLDQLRRIIKSYGVLAEVIDATPKDVASGEGSRELEILAWLAEHPIANFIVIDDESMSKLSSRHIKTKMQYGLQDEHVSYAIELLGEKENV